MVNKSLCVVIITTFVSLNTNVFAQKTGSNPSNSGSPVSEISKLLEENELSLEEAKQVKVTFQLTENKTIELRKIKASNDNIKAFIRNRLENKVLSMQGWHLNKLYELPITIIP